MPENTLEPWQWGLIVVLFAVVLYYIAKTYAILVAAYRERKEEPPPRLYDYEQDDGLLDAWARDAEGELLAVMPAELNADWEIRWRYK